MAQLTMRQRRQRRHKRVRKQAFGTADRPRLVVFRSNRGIGAQLIDDTAGRTLAAASSLDLEAGKGGKLLAQNAKKADISTAVFDRGGYLYHGRVKALADAAREGGIEF